MTSVTIKDLLKTEELDHEAMAAVHGGMINQGGVSHRKLLTGPDGSPVAVYVDGVLINSPTTGYAPA